MWRGGKQRLEPESSDLENIHARKEKEGSQSWLRARARQFGERKGASRLGLIGNLLAQVQPLEP